MFCHRNIKAPRHFCMRIFWYCFDNVSAIETLQHWAVLAQRYFGTAIWLFQHKDILAPVLERPIALMSQCNVRMYMVLRYSHATSTETKFPCAVTSMGTKGTYVKMSIVPKRFCWNVSFRNAMCRNKLKNPSIYNICNTLGRLDDGTNESSTKHLMFQVLFFSWFLAKFFQSILLFFL